MISKRRYLTLELEQVTVENAEYYKQFVEYMKSIEEQFKLEILKESEKTQQNGEKSKTNTEQDPLIKILYRGVMKKTHPDLIKDDAKLLQMNLLANQYKNESNMLGMLDLCDQLDVKIPNLSKKHYDMMQQDIQDLQDRIEQIKTSHSYVWGTSDQTTRDEVLNMILSKNK